MGRRVTTALAAAVALATSAVALPASAADVASVSKSLAISGAVKTPQSLSVADLEALPIEQVEQSDDRDVDGRKLGASVRGVRLTALLDRAALASGGHNDWKHTVVVASGTDGYSVAFSWPELFTTDVGPGVLVIWERDGKPLGDHDGRIALVSAKDLHAGPRNVHWLSKIDVRILAP